jgi:hypothetical protein
MTQFQNPIPFAAPDQADKSLASLPKGWNSAANQVKVTAVTHWTDKLFSFKYKFSNEEVNPKEVADERMTEVSNMLKRVFK